MPNGKQIVSDERYILDVSDLRFVELGESTIELTYDDAAESTLDLEFEDEDKAARMFREIRRVMGNENG